MAIENEELVSSVMKSHARRNRSEDSMQSISVLPQEFRDVVQDYGGFGAELVMQKPFSKADMNPAKNYLTVRFRAAARRKFLRDVDGMMLFKGIPVLFIEPSLNVTEMSLLSIFTAIGSDPSYVLMDNWDIVMKRNGLKTGDIMQLWTFRIIEGDDIDEPKIGFALVRVGKKGQDSKA